jgi:hypothetical protein
MPKTQENSWNRYVRLRVYFLLYTRVERLYAESMIAARYNAICPHCPAPEMEFLDIILTRVFCSMLFLVSSGWRKKNSNSYLVLKIGAKKSA